MKKKKIVILGSTGMAGHMIYEYLSHREDFEIINLAFRKKLNESTIIIDITDKDSVVKFIDKTKPEIIINCTGVLLNGAKNNPANAIYVNAYFPHLLSSIANEIMAKLIHISTDCVFSGNKGNYQPDDPKDAQDIYGMSKALGEIINQKDLTIRTSIIGPEIKVDGEGLLHWFLNQHGTIYGYTDSFWTGITTLQLAKIIEQSIDNNLTGLLQYSNGNKISKFNLLQIFKQSWNKSNIEIIPAPGKKVDKSLVSSYNQSIIQVPDYKTMCDELAKYMNEHVKLYSQYYTDLNLSNYH